MIIVRPRWSKRNISIPPNSQVNATTNKLRINERKNGANKEPKYSFIDRESFIKCNSFPLSSVANSVCTTTHFPGIFDMIRVNSIEIP